MKRIWLAALSLVGLGAAPPPTPADLGPAPSWEQGVALGESAIRATLIDPDSAKIEWPYNFTGGTLKALFGKTRAGYWTCGWVNARNRMGGYAGRSWFLLMINSGQVVSVAVGTPDGVDAASATCPGAVSKGLLAPAPMPAAPTAAAYSAAATTSAAAAAAKGGIGISFGPSPFGAMIMAVAPGSVAEKAGLKPGEVVEAVNGISLKGFDLQTMIRVFQGAPAATTLSIVGAGDVKVVKPAG